MAPKQRKSTNSRRKAPVSNSKKAGVIFPVGRLNRMLKQGRYSQRIGGSAGVFMSGVLEYITAEICELAGNVCEEQGRKTIAPKHINLGILHDEELHKLVASAVISQGGQQVKVHDFLLPHKKGGKQGESSQTV